MERLTRRRIIGLVIGLAGLSILIGPDLAALGSASQLYAPIERSLREPSPTGVGLDRDELPEAVLEFEFGLSTDELLMEGYRRVDEWGLIEQALP
mgnify:CR=1 FL=1